ncbi:MAG: hypothetical protein RLN69_15765 [Woeseiaceae bacterium]
MIRTITVAALLSCSSAAFAADLADHWTLASGRDEQSWEDVVMLSVESQNEIADEYATKNVHPQLAFQCVGGGDGTVSARVDWRRFISSFNTEVGFKADDRELLLVNWGVDKSNKITMPRGKKDGDDFIDYLKGASKLQVEVIPYSESLITVSFDISGIDDALQSLIAECR